MRGWGLLIGFFAQGVTFILSPLKERFGIEDDGPSSGIQGWGMAL